MNKHRAGDSIDIGKMMREQYDDLRWRQGVIYCITKDKSLNLLCMHSKH
jgi:uncharacterized membrane protein